MRGSASCDIISTRPSLLVALDHLRWANLCLVRVLPELAPCLPLAQQVVALVQLDGDRIEEIDYRETRHYLITRDFLNSPERFFKHLFAPVEETEG